jgi:parallel beta-helix repeat protein
MDDGRRPWWKRTRRCVAIGAFVAATTTQIGLNSRAEAEGCTSWAGETSLQAAVDANLCVEVQPGTYTLEKYLLIADGRTLQGDPDHPRSAMVIRAIAPWNTNGNEGVITGFQPPHTDVATIRHLTIDGAGLSTGAIGASDMLIEDVAATGGRCWGIAIVGPNMTVRDSVIEGNGMDPGCPSAPGAGIYVAVNGTGYGAYAPIITGNEISGNTGPGVDIYNVWDGVFEHNHVHDNTDWAGFSLLGSNWSVRENTISHPETFGGQPYISSCNGGPNGSHSSAIFLCQATIADGVKTAGNTIAGNTISSYYGILLIGNDEANALAVPNGNMISDNTFSTNVLRCADDLRRGTKPNRWRGCSPVYF